MTSESAVRLEDLLAQSSWMRALARSLVADPSVADDLAQEAMLAALTRPPDAGVPLRAWLSGVLRNLAAGWRRKEIQRNAREARAEHKLAAPSTDELVGQVEVQQRLAEDVLALPDPYKRTVLLRYFQGLSSAEIARRTSTPEGTVRWRLKRGLDMLRERLDVQHGGDRKAWVAMLSTGLGAPIVAPVGGLAPAAIVQLVGWLGLALLLALALPLGIRFLRVSPQPRAGALTPADVARDDVERDGAAVAHSTDAREFVAPTTSAPKLPDLEVHARVLDADHKPIVAARLACVHGERGFDALTDLAGEVTLTLPEFAGEEGSMLDFALDAAGHVPRKLRARHRGEQVLWLGDQVLATASSIAGRVLDEQREPLVGVTVMVEPLPVADRALARRTVADRRLRSIAPPDSLATAHTDADGRFHFASLPAQFARVWASAPGRWDAASGALDLQAGERLDAGELVLEARRPQECIAGLVRGPDGEPCAGALVIGLAAQHADELYKAHLDAYVTNAGEDGRFELWVEPTADYVIGARDPAARLGRALPRAARAGDREVTLELRTGRYAELTARAPDGTPLAGFNVEVLDAELSQRRDLVRATETEAGVARFELPGYEFRLRIGRPGSKRGSLGPFQPGLQSDRFEVVLEPVEAIHGRVTHAGVALADVLVALQRAHPGERWSARPDLVLGGFPFACFVASTGYDDEMSTDADGRFALHPNPVDRVFVIVDAPGWPRLVHGPAQAQDLIALEELTLELVPGGGLEGIVLPEAGRNPAGTLVGVSAGDGRVFVRRVGPDGAYRFEDLAPGPWQVRALREDLDHEEEQGVLRHSGRHHLGPVDWDVVVEAGKVARFDLSLERETLATLNGRLLLGGRAPGPWRIELISHDGPAAGERDTGSLGSDGRFRYDVRHAGQYQLYLSIGGSDEPLQRIVDDIEIRPGANDWERALDAAFVRVVRSPQAPVVAGRYTLAWTGPDGIYFTAAVVPESDERSIEMLVPAGRVFLVDERYSAATPSSPTLAELELEPGDHGLIELP